MIGQYPIHLLGHGADQGAQTGFHVRDTAGRLPPMEPIFDVTRAQAMVELTSPTTITMSGFCSRMSFKAAHDFRCLRGMRARTCT